ncbi:hypothetical protein D3C74_298290 [compost metagenome]
MFPQRIVKTFNVTGSLTIGNPSLLKLLVSLGAGLPEPSEAFPPPQPANPKTSAPARISAVHFFIANLPACLFIDKIPHSMILPCFFRWN